MYFVFSLTFGKHFVISFIFAISTVNSEIPHLNVAKDTVHDLTRYVFNPLNVRTICYIKHPLYD